MYLFIDTEFARFNCPVEDLVSIAVTNEAGASWYGANRDLRLEACSDFVREHVLPILCTPAPDKVESLAVLGGHLAAWIEAQGPQATVVIDYAGDWFLLVELFEVSGIWPKNLARQPEYLYRLMAENDPESIGRIDADAATFLADKGWAAHNARADAEANHHLWQLSVQAKSAAEGVCR